VRTVPPPIQSLLLPSVSQVPFDIGENPGSLGPCCSYPYSRHVRDGKRLVGRAAEGAWWTSAELSEALQDATAAAERRMARQH
jgi:hypothetical protein